MVKDYIQVNGDHFERNGEKIMLRGWAFGSWMNFEHFMLGMPGTNSMILEAFGKAYGEERAAELADRIITDMVQEADIRYLKELGTNTVRIVLGYHWFWDDAEPFVMKEQGLKYLDRVLRFCADNGMFAILDLHSTPGSQNTDWHSDNRTGVEQFWQYRCFQDQVVWFWEEIAKRCADNPWVVGYDVINEPGWGVKAEQINGFYARVTEAVRRHDPHHILYLSQHVAAMRQAVEEDGVEILGYTPWGCIDVVSASNGLMNKRYGLVYVDWKDGEGGTYNRYRKDSFWWYQRCIASNGEEL